MKMHFCIPVSQQLPEALGGCYVLYSVYLDGFLFCKVRYSQLHRWNEQLRRVFGDCLPPFPPKYYLAMTTAMAEERRDQLERYLQNVTADPHVKRSDVFTEFLTMVQLHTLNITTTKAALDVFLPNGRSINVDILTSDMAERVLEVVAHKLGLHPELLGYFGLFLIQCFPEGKLSVVKKLVDFELPYTSLQSSEVENCKIGLRKWYLDPALDSMLMDCRAAGDLLYMQAVQDIEIEWVKPTMAQREELKALQKKENQTKFLELSQEVRHYGYIQLDPCTCNHPEPGCVAVLSIGNNEISCCITLPDGRTQDIAFQMSRVKCWQVTFLGTLLDTDGPHQTLNQNLELRFQYSEDSRQQWFVIYTKQAFFLSSCLKKMILEKMAKLTEENPEMQIEVPEQSRRKKHPVQESQKDFFNFLRKTRMKKAEGDCVWRTLTEGGL
ncbi:sorting nexin-31 isoform X2 [Meriones unguiculatus]|uniref:sorting nexin-31 isoform X2 n=1 Tax=Meriones unguiculatus TaxID=10047 RepID=UPI00293E4791|nr:sorting nexin-31 isoform X2 [Meriones unguiculatus]